MNRTTLDLAVIAAATAIVLLFAVRAQWRPQSIRFREPTSLIGVVGVVVIIAALILSSVTSSHPVLTATIVAGLVGAVLLFVRAAHRPLSG